MSIFIGTARLGDAGIISLSVYIKPSLVTHQLRYIVDLPFSYFDFMLDFRCVLPEQFLQAHQVSILLVFHVFRFMVLG
jgi:hypothetical protein